jgi:hypothetical protein
MGSLSIEFIFFYLLMLLGIDRSELLWVMPKPEADAMKAEIYSRTTEITAENQQKYLDFFKVCNKFNSSQK